MRSKTSLKLYTLMLSLVVFGSSTLLLLVLPIISTNSIAYARGDNNDEAKFNYQVNLSASASSTPTITIKSPSRDADGFSTYRYNRTKDTSSLPRIMTFTVQEGSNDFDLTMDVCDPTRAVWRTGNNIGIPGTSQTWVVEQNGANWSNILKQNASRGNVSSVKRKYFENLDANCNSTRQDLTPVGNRVIKPLLRSGGSFERSWKQMLVQNPELSSIASKSFYIVLRKGGSNGTIIDKYKMIVGTDGKFRNEPTTSSPQITRGAYTLEVYGTDVTWSITKDYRYWDKNNTENGDGLWLSGAAGNTAVSQLKAMFKDMRANNQTISDLFKKDDSLADYQGRLNKLEDVLYIPGGTSGYGTLRYPEVTKLCYVGAYNAVSGTPFPPQTNSAVRLKLEQRIRSSWMGEIAPYLARGGTSDFPKSNVFNVLPDGSEGNTSLDNAAINLRFLNCLNSDATIASKIDAATKIDLTGYEDVSTNNGADSDKTCKVEGPLGWILAPVCVAATKATAELGKVVTDSLKINPITQTGTAGSVYVAWKSFRDISNAFLVLIFLIAIFYQVLPIEVDAYTVKKVLPRLIAAAIAIQASFFLCQMAIDISNVLGGGIETIFSSINTGSVGSGAAVGVLNGGLTAIVGAGIAIAFIGPVFFLLIAALISVLTMLISIQAREVIIILLVMASPIAILASILPNTEDYFKKWWQNFIKLLLMYPLIQVLLSGSVLVSKVLNVGGLNTIQQVMISFIPVIAFFMVPAMFKMSGSLMGAVSGAINNKGFGISKKIAGRAKEDAKAINKERGATLLSSDKFGKRMAGRILSGNALSFGDRGQRKIRAAINSNYSNVAETVQDQYRNLSNSARYDEMQKLMSSGKAGDRLKATALGDMIAANGGGPEMAKYFDSLEASGKVKRDADGAVLSVDDKIWNEVSKRHGSFLAGAVPHSISKPMSQAGASALIGAKSAGAARELDRQVRAMAASGDTVGVQRLANQFIAASQREDAPDMRKDMVDTFRKLASDGVFATATQNIKGAPIDPATGLPTTDVAQFIDHVTQGGGLSRFIQG